MKEGFACPVGSIDIRHVIQPGETLESIARGFNATIDLIMEANPALNNPDNFRPGDVILVCAFPHTSKAIVKQAPKRDYEARVKELEAALKEVLAINEGPGKLDEDIPDDKEAAYDLGYMDALTDIQTLLLKAGAL